MVIAFVTPEYPDGIMRSGGIGTSISHLARQMNNDGNTIFIIVYGASHDEVRVDETGITFFYVKNVILRPFSFLLTSRKLEKLLNRLVAKEGLQVVEVPDWGGVSALMNLSCAVVMRLNGSETYFANLENRKVRFGTKLLERLAWKRCDAIITVAEFTGRLTAKLFKSNKCFVTIPNAIDIQVFNCNEEQKPEKVVLYCGTLVRKKGVLELPHIFNLVHKGYPTAKFVIVGSDAPDQLTGSVSTWKMMHEQFDENTKAKVHYAGSLDYSNIRTLLSSASVCVFPSYAEACPLSWLEAMAMQKAIVASDKAWAREVITPDFEGLLRNSSQHFAFAEAIINFLNRPEFAKECGRAARQKVISNFNVQDIASRIVEVYRTTLIKTSI